MKYLLMNDDKYVCMNRDNGSSFEIHAAAHGPYKNEKRRDDYLLCIFIMSAFMVLSDSVAVSSIGGAIACFVAGSFVARTVSV